MSDAAERRRRWGCGVDGCGLLRGYLCAACADARAEDQRLRKYGITAEEYAQMLQAQRGRCAICDEEFGGDRPQIDHDHRIRGRAAVRRLLCGDCNIRTIGGLDRGATPYQAPMRALRAAWYLTRAIRRFAVDGSERATLADALETIDQASTALDTASVFQLGYVLKVKEGRPPPEHSEWAEFIARWSELEG